MKEDSLFQKSKDQFRRMPQGLKAFSAIIAVLMLFFLGFALAGVLINYLSPGTFFHLFGYIGLFPALLLALISFVFFQIDLLVFVIRSHRPGFLFLNLLIIPLLCLTALSRFADSSTTYERYIKEFDSSLVIASDSFLLGGWSTIYQKNGPFSLRNVTGVTGDDGYEPLADEKFYSIQVYPKGVAITYDNGTGMESPYETLYLLFENQLWKKTANLEDLERIGQ